MGRIVTIFASILFSCTFAGLAGAACVMGMGDCPISTAEAEKLIRPHIDGQVQGSFTFSRVLLATTANSPAELPQKMDGMSKALDIINSNGDCSRVDQLVQRWPGGWNQNCNIARILRLRGLATFDLLNSPGNYAGTTAIWLRMTVTERGKELAKGVARETRDEVTFSTATVRFDRILRTTHQAPQSAIEYQYLIIPNVWGHVQSLKEGDTLPIVQKTSVATAERWSDGWRLITKPGIAR